MVCTTRDASDDVLVECAEAAGAAVFRGDRDDVLVRWLDAATEYNVEFFAACDGDDVFCDPEYVDRVIECYEESRADFVTCEGLPFGAAPTGYSRVGLARVCAAKKDTETEGQARFFQDDRLVRRATVTAAPDLRHDAARMTIDYPEDLTFARAVVEHLERPDRPPFTLHDIVELLKRDPDLVEINRGRQEQYWERFHAKYPPVDMDV